jgi:5'-nucleotidase
MIRILLTNDDGIAAPGLHALEEAVANLGEVHVVAPLTEQSGTSRAITLRRPLRYETKGVRRHAVEGTPADTVMMAVSQILGFRPDFAISGINSGPNLGENIYYSGTVAAAAEAAKYGIPAIALSVNARTGIDYSAAAEFGARLASKMIEDGLPSGVALNVNVPCPWTGGIEITKQSRKISRNLMIEIADPHGRPYYWMHEEVPLTDAEPGTDYAAIRDGHVSITPIRFDHTEEALIEPLRQSVVASLLR